LEGSHITAIVKPYFLLKTIRRIFWDNYWSNDLRLPVNDSTSITKTVKPRKKQPVTTTINNNDLLEVSIATV